MPKWRRLSVRFLRLFQIVVLDTISDRPWWVSWQHFYSQNLPTKKLQATLPNSLPWRHATPTNIIHNSFVTLTFKRTGAWGKSWSHQIYVYDLNLLPELLVWHLSSRMTLDQFFPHLNDISRISLLRQFLLFKWWSHFICKISYFTH